MHPDVDLIYSDEDKIDERGQRYKAYCKPDWDPDLFGSQNLFSHLGVYRTALVRRVGGFRTGFEGSQDYDLALRCTRETDPGRIRHIPYVLYHWRAIATSTAAGGRVKRYAFTAARDALREHFAQRDPRIGVDFGRFLALYRVQYPLPEPPPRVSIIVVTHDGLHRRTVHRLLRTRYPLMELLVVDVGVHDQPTLDVLREVAASALARVLRCNASSNRSAAINFAAREARGTVLALLAPTVEPIDLDWLAEMVSHALRPEIGPVGARLLARDGTVWHAGLVMGLQGIAGNLHHGLPEDSQGYFGRAQAIQGFTAVSGACLVVRREVFDRVGGFDEQNLPSRWNDVDFCLRTRAAGYRTLWTPYAELQLVASCGPHNELVPDEERAAEYMRGRWGAALESDPHYSPNLSLRSERPVLAWPPRRQLPWRDGPGISSGDGVPRSDAHRLAEDPGRGPIVTIRPPRLPGGNGFRMFSQAGRDQIAREIANHGWDAFEQPLPDVFTACAAGSTGLVLDIGANTGFYTLLALVSSRACTVHAFEPLRPVADLLDANLALNGLGSRVVVFRQAVSDLGGTATLFLPDASHGLIETSASLNKSFKETVGRTLQVAVTTVDEHWRDSGDARRIDIIKVDVESFERKVVAGSARILAEHRPLVFLKLLPPGDAKSLEEATKLYRYQAVRLRPGHATVAEELLFDPSGWNQMLVPREHLQHWLRILSGFLTVTEE
jgi:FkbM family methyltransferase